MTEYSKNVTIGEAFDNFFEDGKWSRFSEGAVEYVDYSGTCLFAGETTNVVIRFWSSDTEYRVEKVCFDGVEISPIIYSEIFRVIFDESNQDSIDNEKVMSSKSGELSEYDEPIGDDGSEIMFADTISEMAGVYTDIEGYNITVNIELNENDLADVTLATGDYSPDYIFEDCCPVDNLCCFEIYAGNQIIYIALDSDGYLSVSGCEMETYNTIYQKQ